MKLLIINSLGAIAIFLYILFMLPVESLAADDPDLWVCNNYGFGDTGCVQCVANSADPNICQVIDPVYKSGLYPGVGCRPGTIAPPADVCSGLDYGSVCSSFIFACEPLTIPNGGFYCDFDHPDICVGCDSDPNTPWVECPSGEQVYTSENICLPSCATPNEQMNSCTSLGEGYACKDSCAGNEAEITSDQIEECPDPSQVCCAPPDQTTAAKVAGKCAGGKGWINTAIGCIPYQTTEETTQFFISWSLGVAGGIALFLISISAVKIMTTKGDPKRLQDARDTLSSAIAGLVMIVLSIYLIRFISQELLNLF